MSVVICVVAIVITASYGWHEITLREAYDQGRSGIPRGTPDENTPNRPQTPLYVENYDNLAPDQVRILIQELPKLKDLMKIVYFSRSPSDNEVLVLWRQFENIFTRSGLMPALITEMPRGPDEEGLMFAVKNPNELSATAQKFREAFEIANIRMKIIKLPDGLVNLNDTDFVIFIGPRPIRWN